MQSNARHLGLQRKADLQRTFLYIRYSLSQRSAVIAPTRLKAGPSCGNTGSASSVSISLPGQGLNRLTMRTQPNPKVGAFLYCVIPRFVNSQFECCSLRRYGNSFCGAVTAITILKARVWTLWHLVDATVRWSSRKQITLFDIVKKWNVLRVAWGLDRR